MQCLSCSIHQQGVTTVGGLIAASDYFEVRQDYAVPIPGFMIISSKRHVRSMDDFTPAERTDFIEFCCRMRRQMREILGVDEITMVQEENSAHFHLWLFPWYSWMKPFGNDVASLRPIMRYAREHLTTQSHSDAVHGAAQKLKKNCYVMK